MTKKRIRDDNNTCGTSVASAVASRSNHEMDREQIRALMAAFLIRNNFELIRMTGPHARTFFEATAFEIIRIKKASFAHFSNVSILADHLIQVAVEALITAAADEEGGKGLFADLSAEERMTRIKADIQAIQSEDMSAVISAESLEWICTQAPTLFDVHYWFIDVGLNGTIRYDPNIASNVNQSNVLRIVRFEGSHFDVWRSAGKVHQIASFFCSNREDAKTIRETTGLYTLDHMLAADIGVHDIERETHKRAEQLAEIDLSKTHHDCIEHLMGIIDSSTQPDAPEPEALGLSSCILEYIKSVDYTRTIETFQRTKQSELMWRGQIIDITLHGFTKPPFSCAGDVVFRTKELTGIKPDFFSGMEPTNQKLPNKTGTGGTLFLPWLFAEMKHDHQDSDDRYKLGFEQASALQIQNDMINLLTEQAGRTLYTSKLKLPFAIGLYFEGSRVTVAMTCMDRKAESIHYFLFPDFDLKAQRATYLAVLAYIYSLGNKLLYSFAELRRQVDGEVLSIEGKEDAPTATKPYERMEKEMRKIGSAMQESQSPSHGSKSTVGTLDEAPPSILASFPSDQYDQYHYLYMKSSSHVIAAKRKSDGKDVVIKIKTRESYDPWPEHKILCSLQDRADVVKLISLHHGVITPTHPSLEPTLLNLRLRYRLHDNSSKLRSYIWVFERVMNLRPPSDLSELLVYMRGLLQGLDSLHSRGIIHGDIKEDNVLFDARKEQVVFIDFEFSTTTTTTRRNGPHDQHTVEGTEGYIAPELFVWQTKKTFASDIYSTGVLFSNLMLGVPIRADADARSLLMCSSLDQVLLWRQDRLASNGSSEALQQLPPTWNYDLFIGCVQPMLHAVPSKRPTAAAALQRLMSFVLACYRSIATSN